MIKQRSFLFIILLFSFFESAAQSYYSFEERIPKEWNNADGGQLSVSTLHSKQGKASLQWQWNSGSKLIADDPDSVSLNCRTKGSAVRAWIYNPSAINDSIRIDFSGPSGAILAGFNFRLNFTGWRFLWVSFDRDLNYRYRVGEELKTMIIKAPSKGRGSLFFDMVETIPSSGSTWHRYSDLQYDVMEGGAAANERNLSYNSQPDKSGIDLGDTVIADKIKARLRNWFLGNDSYKGRPIYDERLSALTGKVNQVLNASNSWNQKTVLKRQGDQSVIAMNRKDGSVIGLHGDLIGYKPIFNDVNTSWIFELALDVALHHGADKNKLQRCIDVMDWMYDQGYAEGSGLGTGLTQLRSEGFPFAFFLICDYLPVQKKDRYLKTIRWIARDVFDGPGRSADEIRGAALSKLIYALSITDPAERLAELRYFILYMNNAVAISPGYFGLIKPDYSVYHHNMPYYSEYGDDAIHQAAIILYLLRDTKFSLSAVSCNNIKESVLNIADISARYMVPASVSGRFPDNRENVSELIPALAYIGLSDTLHDARVTRAFNRLYKPDDPAVQRNLRSSSLGIQYTTSPGAAIAIDDYARGVKAGPFTESSLTKFLPFSGLFAAKQNDWLITMKGFSKYIIDFECIRNEGRFSRYLSYGFMQIVSESRGFNNYTQDKSFDWIHIPGATTIDLPVSKIDVRGPGNNPKERNFGDETFLGGLGMNSGPGMFAFHLHDNVFDPTFRAKKTVFYFGNLVFCMASGISDNDADHSVHTTLFQNFAGQKLTVNGKNIISDQFSGALGSFTRIQNSWGCDYIVFPGEGSLNVRTRTQRTADFTGTAMPETAYELAWIDHGARAVNAKYTYAILLQHDPGVVKKLTDLSNPLIKVIKQDENVHAIYDSDEKIWAYAFFNKKVDMGSNSLVSAVSRPCVIMAQLKKNKKLAVFLSDPDLNRPAPSEKTKVSAGLSRELTIVLKGKYALVNPLLKGISLASAGDSTTISATVKDGRQCEIELTMLTN